MSANIGELADSRLPLDLACACERKSVPGSSKGALGVQKGSWGIPGEAQGSPRSSQRAPPSVQEEPQGVPGDPNDIPRDAIEISKFVLGRPGPPQGAAPRRNFFEIEVQMDGRKNVFSIVNS